MIWGPVHSTLSSKPELRDRVKRWSECQHRNGLQASGLARLHPSVRQTHTPRHKVGTATGFACGHLSLASYRTEGQEVCGPAGSLPPQREDAEEAELCAPGSCSHTYTADKSPAITGGEGVGARGASKICTSTWKHGVFPQHKWQMLIIYFYFSSIQKKSLSYIFTL